MKKIVKGNDFALKIPVSKKVNGDIVLWYFAQSLMYAGSIFGVAIAIDAKFENIKNKFLNHNRDEKD